MPRTVQKVGKTLNNAVTSKQQVPNNTMQFPVTPGKCPVY